MSKYIDIRHRYDFLCDHPGCDEEWVYENELPGQMRPDQRGANRMVKAEGWHIGAKSRGADFCPEHAPARVVRLQRAKQ